MDLPHDHKRIDFANGACLTNFQPPQNVLHPLSAGNHRLLPSEINSFQPADSFQNQELMNASTIHVNPYHDFPLELQFARLNLSNSPSYRRSMLMRNSSINSSIDLPLPHDRYVAQTPNLSNLDPQRLMTVDQFSLGHHENLDFFGTRNCNLGGFYHDYDSVGNVYGRGTNSNGGLIGYELHGNGFHMNRNCFRGRNNNESVYRTKQRVNVNLQSLEELRGGILCAAKDQHGCKFLLRRFEEKKPEEIQLIFSELKDHIRELMVDRFGNYLIQKLFEVCNEQQITQLLAVVISDERILMAICLDMHGTRAIQKLVEHLTTPKQKSIIVSVLRNIAVTLTKSTNGHHVIQHCLKFFSGEDVKYILNEISENCLEIAMDKSGCCVLPHCVAHAQGESQNRLLQEIISNALVLAEHPYGNYVVQYILSLRLPNVTADIVDQLAGKYVNLSMNKYGSNVVEKCLQESEEEQAIQIITEIINSPNFLMVLQDPFGNYVAQSALAISKGGVRHAMIKLILVHYPFLHSHPHGKRVLALTRGSKQRV